MKKPKKIIIIVLAATLMLLVTTPFTINTVARISIERMFHDATGLQLKVQSFNIGLIRSLVRIKGLRLLSPQGHKDRVMLDIAELYIDYNLPAALNGKAHVEELDINLREIMVSKNKQGQINLDALKKAQEKQENSMESSEEDQAEVQIDKLKLRIGKVTFKDYSEESVPTIKEFYLYLDEEYENLTDPYALVEFMIVRGLVNTNIASLAKFDLIPLIKDLPDPLKQATIMASKAADKAAELSTQISEKAKDTFEKISRKFKNYFQSDSKK
jgi:uncharacterized protein involved in outer membrane biogenesis